MTDSRISREEMSATTMGRRQNIGDNAGQTEPDKKKRKLGAKKASSFKPQPVQLPKSSDTPPEEEHNLPPPPSERKIARRRESTRAIRERQPQSPSPPPVLKRGRTVSAGDGTTLQPAAAASSSSSAPQSRQPSNSGHPYGSSNPSRPNARQSSVARLPSPPRTIPQQPAFGSKSVMGPPDVFVRKTRKSMAGLHQQDFTDEVITIPERETPMIRKNKELREAQSRRSSLGMRGQRASSSLGRGDLSIPHASVSSSQFYTHIASTQPEPIRARHLLVYCADRAFKSDVKSSKSKGKAKRGDIPRTEEGDKLMGDIMSEFLSGLGMGAVDTNVFASGPSTSSASTLRPHPKNVANKAAKEKEELAIKKYKAEQNAWARLKMDIEREKKMTVDRLAKKAKADLTPSMSSASGWMQEAMKLAESVIEAGEGDLTEMGEFPDVEFKIDTLHQTSHLALQYNQQATRFLDGIFSSLSTDLRIRERHSDADVRNPDDPPDLTTLVQPIASSSSSSKQPQASRDPIHMLRALASAEASQVSDEALAAAASAPPAHLGQSTSATPRRVGVTPTPRRGLGAGTTPRRPASTTPGPAEQ